MFIVIINEQLEGLHAALIPAVEYKSRWDDPPQVDIIFLRSVMVTAQYFSKFRNRNYLLDKFS